ncbi:MAG: Asp-tRNA(Asn)/Glu-tRNA(Gln) amidotransferase subunit GatC [Candidatus Paceibacterota bacterium]|jgi:aspartyl-tRNA(Asn)/glutamyl-tRNA(Gln) amidotransferase subunit C
MDEAGIEKLAKLARLKLSTEEKKKFAKEIGAILEYVGQIKEAGAETAERKIPDLRNVMRADDASHESGIHTEDLLNSAPEREGQYIKVKKIL